MPLSKAELFQNASCNDSQWKQNFNQVCKKFHQGSHSQQKCVKSLHDACETVIHHKNDAQVVESFMNCMKSNSSCKNLNECTQVCSQK